jgi:hypothetical protein
MRKRFHCALDECIEVETFNFLVFAEIRKEAFQFWILLAGFMFD